MSRIEVAFNQLGHLPLFIRLRQKVLPMERKDDRVLQTMDQPQRSLQLANVLRHVGAGEMLPARPTGRIQAHVTLRVHRLIIAP